MSKLIVSEGYRPILSVYETQTAIGTIKKVFEENSSNAINLRCVSSPVFVEPKTGLNDDRNGAERPLKFDIPETKPNARIVHSLAKRERIAGCYQ